MAVGKKQGLLKLKQKTQKNCLKHFENSLKCTDTVVRNVWKTFMCFLTAFNHRQMLQLTVSKCPKYDQQI